MSKNYILILLGIFTCLPTFAQSDFTKVADAKAIYAKLKAVSDKTNTIEADFVEEKYLAAFNKPQITKGKFYYKKSGEKMRWAQNFPYEYIILMNGNTLRIKDNGKEKDLGAGGKMALKVNGFMMKLIEGDFQDSKEVTSTCFQSSKEYMIQLVPNAKPLNKVYTKIEVYFSKVDKRLQSISFYEVNGDKRITKYINQKYNGQINDNLFLNF